MPVLKLVGVEYFSKFLLLRLTKFESYFQSYVTYFNGVKQLASRKARKTHLISIHGLVLGMDFRYTLYNIHFLEISPRNISSSPMLLFDIFGDKILSDLKNHKFPKFALIFHTNFAILSCI